MKTKIAGVLAIGALALALAGCAKSPAKCSDEKTLAQLTGQIIGQIDISQLDQIPLTSLKVINTRATAFDENIKKLSCEGTLTMSNQLKLPIRYESQLDDDNKQIVLLKDFDVQALFSSASDLTTTATMTTTNAAPVQTTSAIAAPNSESSPVNKIKKLYADFPVDSTDSVQNLAVPELSKLFTPSLISLINHDNTCAEESGSICNLDFSLQWDSQDPTGAKATILQGESPAQVKVSIHGDGDPRELLYIMQQTPNGWRISDIKYRHGSLVEILTRQVRTSKKTGTYPSCSSQCPDHNLGIEL